MVRYTKNPGFSGNSYRRRDHWDKVRQNTLHNPRSLLERGKPLET